MCRWWASCRAAWSSARCQKGFAITSFDFDADRGKVCPMAMHVAFVYADILRYGGTMPRMKDGAITFCCPDVEVINVFEIRKEAE